MATLATSRTAERLATLVEMHTYSRPHRSRTERTFIRRYLRSLPGAYFDAFGNIHVTIGTSTILWSAHTDTVARVAGMQRVRMSADDVLSLAATDSPQTSGRVLGADNTAGVFLLREMVLAGIPGHYIFHRGEESGQIGSRQLSDAFDWSAYTHAIAFDRRGTADIITHQMGMRTCSDLCADSIADALNASHADLNMRPDDSGSYTDTEAYAEQIPECTNIAVGYQSAHSALETLDVSHVFHLLDGLLSVDWNQLPVNRDPRAPEPRYYGGPSTSASLFRHESWDDTADPIVWSDGRDVLRASDIDTTDDDLLSADFRDRDYFRDATYAKVQRQLREQINSLRRTH